MTNTTFEFAFKDLNLTVTQIEDVMGYKEGEDRELVSELIAEVFMESEEIAKIKAQYNIFGDLFFDNKRRNIEIRNTVFQVQKIVFGQLKKSSSLAVFLCTAGEEIGIRSRQAMQERDLLKGYVYDVIGSEIVEAAAELMQDNLEKAAGLKGMNITNRYSPGYCGWDVSEQNKLFKLMPENFCGIKLTPSALMDPVKSVSGFIGIGENVKRHAYTCNICDMEHCIYRKVREKKGNIL